MGMFLALSGVINKTQIEVEKSLTKFLESVGGGLKQKQLTSDNENCCILATSENNTTVFYPNGYLEWEKSSEFLSKDLETPVFSFHIHDGDLWMYIMYNKGKVVDMYNPIPDYWEEDISKEEIESWKGNATIISKYVKDINPKDIEKYLVRWNDDAGEGTKAYGDDEYSREDWQLLDFMRKLKLPYPTDDKGNIIGETYQFWTKEHKLVQTLNNQKQNDNPNEITKPWWKF